MIHAFLFVVVMSTHCIALMAGMEHSGIKYSDRMRHEGQQMVATCSICRPCIATGNNAFKY